MQLEIKPPTFTFHGEGGKPLVTLHPDGRVEVAEGCSMDAATSAFWEALETAGFQRMNDALASLTRELEEISSAVEPWIRHARSIENEDGPLRIWTARGYREVPSEDVQSMARLAHRLSRPTLEADGR